MKIYTGKMKTTLAIALATMLSIPFATASIPEMEAKMDEAVRAIAAEYGDPQYSLFVTNSPEMGELVNDRIPILGEASEIITAIEDLENQKFQLESRVSQLYLLVDEVESLLNRFSPDRFSPDRFSPDRFSPVKKTTENRNKWENTPPNKVVSLLPGRTNPKNLPEIPSLGDQPEPVN